MQHRLIVCALSLLTVLAAGLAHADLKVGLVQQQAANGTPNFTQNFTDSEYGGTDDVKAVIFIGGKNTTVDSATTDLNMNIGIAADDGSELAYGIRSLDNQATSLSSDRVHFDHAYIYADGGAASSGEFTVTDWITNGVQVTWEDQSNSELITAVMFGGDIDAAVLEGDFLNATAPETITITHGLSCTPEVILALMSQATSQPGNSSVPARLSIGWWTTGGTYSTGIYLAGGGAAAAVTTQALITDGIAGLMSSPTGTAVSHTITIANVDADSFDAVASAQTNSLIGFLAMCSTGPNPIVAKVGQITGNTSPGTAAEITGMSVQPKVFFGIPTVNTTGASDTDAGGVQGLIAAVDDPSGSGTTCGDTSTKCGGVITAIDDGSDNTNVNQQITNSCAIKPLTVTGTTDGCAQIESWDSGGITFDYTDAFSDAYLIPYIAMGMDESAPAPTWTAEPSTTSQTDTTITFSYTADANADNIFCALYPAGTAEQTGADIEAATGAHGDSTEATTGSADSLSITSSDSPEFPVYDRQCVLKGAGGYSTVALAEDEPLDAPTGFQDVTLTSISTTSPCKDNNDEEDPDIVATDIVRISQNTSPGSFPLNVEVDCDMDYAGSQARQEVTWSVYDYSVMDYMAGSPASLWFNNLSPICGGLQELRLKVGVAMDTESLPCSDGENDTLSCSLTSGTPQDGIDVNANCTITGTPTVEDEDGVAITITVDDGHGGVTTQDYLLRTFDTITAPNVVGLPLGEAIETLQATLLDAGVISLEYSTTIAPGLVISQDPAASTEVDWPGSVDLVVSRGVSVRNQRIGVGVGVH